MAVGAWICLCPPDIEKSSKSKTTGPRELSTIQNIAVLLNERELRHSMKIHVIGAVWLQLFLPTVKDITSGYGANGTVFEYW
jgi:hypothetical protein